MTMKIFFKNSFYILLVIIIINIAWNLLAPRPIKFENFKSAEQAKAYLDEHYPRGTDINKVLADLSSSGAEYKQRSVKIPPHQMSIRIDSDYEKVFEGRYYNNFFSLYPFSMFYFSLYVDEEKLVGIFIKKASSIEFP
jgi:hypothetical protein